MQASSSSYRAERVAIDLGDRSYVIQIGTDLLESSKSFEGLPNASTALVVTNQTIAPLYLKRLTQALAPRYQRIFSVLLPDGEAYKTWDSLNLIFDALLSRGCDRKTILFALGGGVVGDITGFAAASFMRGVPFVQVPTTLLAQVDSSVGGKTAINHPLGKNMIGAFYQPHRVICDLGALKTLPGREMSAGLAEVIKYGPIADMNFFAWIEDHLPELLSQEPDALAYAVKRCCEIKAQVVAEDERETGLRAILNFGHTFGHAIETGMGYGVWLHGEAVGCGMVMATRLSMMLGMVDQAFLTRVTDVVMRAGLSHRAPVLHATENVEAYLALMRLDKKSEAGEIRFVLTDGGGRAVVRAVPDGLVREVIAVSCGS